jgi:polyisoprenoid-binding protein YceI
MHKKIFVFIKREYNRCTHAMEVTMSKSIFLLVFLALLTVACGGQPAAESSTESYPAPQQSEPQMDTGDSAYPPPYPVSTPINTFDTAYPAPEGGLQAFRIIPGESKIIYEVGEVFLNQDNAFNLAVGITTEVNGEILVDRENPQNSSLGVVSVDISQFTSDNQRRDNAIRERFLQSAQYPIVEFSPQDIQGLPETYEQGQEITFQISGDLTIRDVTKPATFEVKMTGNGDTITGEATTTILMSDYGFGPISIAGILNTEDEVNIIFVFKALP